jgi:hypothetical protein
MHKYSNRDPENQILAAITGTLSELGDSTMNSLLWHLENKGISLNPHDFVLKLFYDGLQELLGNGADMLMQEIYEHLLKQLGVDPEPEDGLSPFDMIEKIMTTAKGGG